MCFSTHSPVTSGALGFTLCRRSRLSAPLRTKDGRSFLFRIIHFAELAEGAISSPASLMGVTNCNWNQVPVVSPHSFPSYRLYSLHGSILAYPPHNALSLKRLFIPEAVTEVSLAFNDIEQLHSTLLVELRC